MKYTAFTHIQDIIDDAETNWDGFVQDLIERKAVSWLSEHQMRNELSEELKEHIHSEWSEIYPYLSALRLFETLRHIDNLVMAPFISSFRTNHQHDIDIELEAFHKRNQAIDGLFGIKESTAKPILGFLMVSDGDKEKSIFLVYEGENTYGSKADSKNPIHQSIVTDEPLLQGTHFSITAARNKDPYFRVLNGAPFRKESNPRFKEGVLEYRSHLVLGEMHVTLLENFN